MFRRFMTTNHFEIRLKAEALDPIAWLESANRLIASAEKLEDYFEEFWNTLKTEKILDDSKVSILFMIYSYAIENLLKAIIVIRDKQNLSSQNWGKLPNSLQGHNLYQLCKKSGLDNLAREYESILKKLSRSAEWYGRYPTPIKASDYNNLRSSENESNGISLSGHTPIDLNEIKKIINELKSNLYNYLQRI